MTRMRPPIGGAPVGVLADLDPASASAVLYLRAWCDGKEDRLSADLSPVLGQAAASRISAEFSHLCTLCVRQGRRPLSRHHLGCKCLGADESCFATLLRAATEGQDADAMLIASLMMGADKAPLSVALAQSVGTALSRSAPRSVNPDTQDFTGPISGPVYPMPNRQH